MYVCFIGRGLQYYITSELFVFISSFHSFHRLLIAFICCAGDILRSMINLCVVYSLTVGGLNTVSILYHIRTLNRDDLCGSIPYQSVLNQGSIHATVQSKTKSAEKVFNPNKL